ncbi:GNAT family N-acetyltransferase [Terriglobus sp.]|uniref:GNAT family N-acetyltransferase n=1 Tax=Terriglobus sp. TaxID=1889013 RepID=UPI003AFFFEE9
MESIRPATSEDAVLITQHRAKMFNDNKFASTDAMDAMSLAFEPWVRKRLRDGRYVGLIVEENGEPIASAGVFFADFPPHWMDAEPSRPYLLNFYTAPAARGRGFAKQLLQMLIDECQGRGAKAITLHASKFGKPIYEKFGFEGTNEMMLKLK